MKRIACLLSVMVVMATMLTASRADLAPRPVTGDLINAACFIRAGGSLGEEYKSCVADFEKDKKPVSFGLLTPEGEVYVLVSEKEQAFQGFRLGDRVQVRGVRTIMVGGMKKVSE